MKLSPLAGHLPASDLLTDIPSLISSYYTEKPDPARPGEAASFGTSGHRGSPCKTGFNEDHILAVTQAVCDIRRANGVSGPLFLGKDTHALSEPSFRTALQVLTANGVQVRIQSGGGFTPTPAVSHAILGWNRGRDHGLADGIVITPSHNPPDNGGFKYNTPDGGPADTSVTSCIEARANELLAGHNRLVQHMHYQTARNSGLVVEYDYLTRYVEDMASAIDFEVIASSGLNIGVNPLGGASLAYWEPLARRYDLNLTMISSEYDPTFRFVPCDHDGKIRMDCSPPYAMSELLKIKEHFDLAFALDPDSDRHGIVTPRGLMNPNHYLSVVTDYLLRRRKHWPAQAKIGKTVVTSSMLDRVCADLGHEFYEVPVGFKWFVPGLSAGWLGLGCEESAGASFLSKDGTAWSTDKDGLLLGMLAAEMTARSGKNPQELYDGLAARLGAPLYERVDSPLDGRGRQALAGLTPDRVKIKDLAGARVRAVLTHAPGNGAAIGGLKIVSDDGWFAVRPSGTEAVCKVYLEGFRGEEHFAVLRSQALAFVQGIMA